MTPREAARPSLDVESVRPRSRYALETGYEAPLKETSNYREKRDRSRVPRGKIPATSFGDEADEGVPPFGRKMTIRGQKPEERMQLINQRGEARRGDPVAQRLDDPRMDTVCARRRSGRRVGDDVEETLRGKTCEWG